MLCPAWASTPMARARAAAWSPKKCSACARVLVIEAKDRDHAYTLAQEALSCGDFEIDEMEIRDDNVDPIKTARLRSSADAVSDPND